jgi:hypothetical protein
MLSPRSRFESLCRIGAFALLGWMFGDSVFPTSGRRIERATSAQLESRLEAWTRSASNVGLHGDFDAAPSAWAIDWLGALRHSGHAVTWSGSPPALALSAEALADPRGGARVDVAAPGGTNVAIRDDASAIDSIRVVNLGGSVTAPVIVGRVTANAAGESASATVADSTRRRSIVVVGAAGWEGKFIVAALEERGWTVKARFTVAPAVDVTPPGGSLALDTARTSAVIVVDTSLQALGGAIDRFVRSGGGLILAGPASLTSLSDLAPGSLSTRIRPAVLPSDTIGLGSTGFYPVANLKPDAVVLERRASGVAIAARRVGAGRVVQLGYDDSWRWRMAGANGSENAHREWWSRLVSAVAYAPPVASAPTAETRGAPLAELVDRLGPARVAGPPIAGRGPIDRRLLLVAMMILLLAEWGSRRLRGFK